MKGYQVFYCAGPENLELCLNGLLQKQLDTNHNRTQSFTGVDLEILPHAGSDPRYTVIARWSN